MKKILTERTAIFLMISILSLIIVFHLLVLTGIIPFQIVWGGRLTDHSQMVRFESVSIIINLTMLGIVVVRAGILKVRIKPLILTIALWLMFGLFLMNTVGNVFAINPLEKWIFTPMTLLLALCCLRLVIPSNRTAISNNSR